MSAELFQHSLVIKANAGTVERGQKLVAYITGVFAAKDAEKEAMDARDDDDEITACLIAKIPAEAVKMAAIEDHLITLPLAANLDISELAFIRRRANKYGYATARRISGDHDMNIGGIAVVNGKAVA